MFEPPLAVLKYLYGLVPKSFKVSKGKLRFNYLMVHYAYLISMSIIGSVIIYGGGAMPYNDALFFAVGCATQSGLNTINVNDVATYQQVTFMLIACVTNPIFINTVVVFVRLYWFEKRFKHIVQELREKRRARAPTISRTRSEMKAGDARDLEAARGIQIGVNGREIRVLHETTKPNGMSENPIHDDKIEEFHAKLRSSSEEESETPSPEGSNTSNHDVEDDVIQAAISRQTVGEAEQVVSDSSASHGGDTSPTLHRDIRFADEVSPAENEKDVPSDKPPEGEDIAKHIAFRESQRDRAKAGHTLRIPGPRAFEEGAEPEELSDSDEENHPGTAGEKKLAPVRTATEREGANTSGDDHTNRGGIKFEAQNHPAHRQSTEGFEEPVETPVSTFGRIWDRVRRPPSSLSDARGTIGHTFSQFSTALSRERSGERETDHMPYLSWQATTGRNSAFLGLNEAQREELGGIEYRSLKTLAKILLFYFVGFHLTGMLVNLPWILRSPGYKQVIQGFGVNPAWWAIFTAASEFNDLGLTLTPNSMESFQTATLILLYGSFLIIIGNTGFPIGLRFVIWFTSKFTHYGSRMWEELRFLLDHPRRCFVLLFPGKASWWLFWILVLLNGIDLVFYIVLDLHDSTVTSVPGGYRVLDGWYQAVCTRTAGFAVVNIANLHPAIQVSYLIMMYISVFPIAISVRRTNVYEEKSLGIFGGEEEGGDDENQSYVSQHLRRQLSFDLWFIFLGLFIIAIVEGERIQAVDQPAFTLFAILFEIVSAYGTVGLSLGYPTDDTSFSAQFHIISKLVIMAMMLRGRHRGLPYALDRAILLPSDQKSKRERETDEAPEDHQLQRRGSIFAETNARQLHGANWRQFDLDEQGLPRQHLVHQSSGVDASATPATVGRSSTGGEEDIRQRHKRRGSAVSTNSNRPTPRRRSKSLSRVIAGGLSAGPTFSKND
ncbi:cation transport protein-domain-containing protein [Neohortaea acidophila]|uniref:Potassium transport protein n=1 Tax=Neohortaea acidophila TaxID=245834 RepID=A0A6A6PTE0_9PEZI|nr:cation transport protein-domain-containing protein [Neohortaea acidophila]KAF2483378.1 cation transport protein-domain-containing protein [Neohortaea acidophila]